LFCHYYHFKYKNEENILNNNKFDKFIMHCTFIGTYQRILDVLNKFNYKINDD